MKSRSSFCHRVRKQFLGILTLIFACSVTLAPLSAHATGATLKRSVSNMLMAPLDIATAPVTSVRILVNGFQTQDDSTLKRAVYVVPGFVFLNLLTVGGSVLREVSGVLELVPGIVLVASKSDLQPLFAPTNDAAALVDADIVVLRIKFGLDYTKTISGGSATKGEGSAFGKPVEQEQGDTDAPPPPTSDTTDNEGE